MTKGLLETLIGNLLLTKGNKSTHQIVMITNVLLVDLPKINTGSSTKKTIHQLVWLLLAISHDGHDDFGGPGATAGPTTTKLGEKSPHPAPGCTAARGFRRFPPGL